MTLILLAISLSIALCVLAFNFAIYALPFMVGLTAFQYAWGAETGFLLSGLAALVAALLSIALVIAVLGFAKNPILRLVALAVFAVPAMIAGYALARGVAHNAIESEIALNLLCGTSGLIVGIAAMVNLNGLGEAVLSS
ncbi:hypothetical protein D2T29_18590 [Sinirhodobacter populi]|uniref:Uncharacterized protein n=1 Tax=Paenirhodobacter populi TaxID=2306993 RepID=A0A443K3S8_9RHOB|nr:hypothetical protein [Sinirhodobacter populi]RWR27395.1 hypothetical protein D2T29_18590 [Sinirhodobacter populi]